MSEITDEKLEKYLAITKKAIGAVQFGKQRDINWKKMSEEYLDMATRYLRDAEFYKNKGDFVTAFAACNYAHGWIDAGVRIGVLSAPEGSEDYIMPVD